LKPSDWITRWTHLAAPGATVLDVACGSGRHLAWFAAQGHAVTGIDRDLSGAQPLATTAHLVQADIESGPWPLQHDGQTRTFGVVVVTNYLWRPLLPTLIASVAPGGVLLYETFTAGNAQWGRPSRPEFLLQPGELLQACAGLHIVAYECGLLESPTRVVQRIAALRLAKPDQEPLHFEAPRL
jgi:SAM-dependent methyltransferase